MDTHSNHPAASSLAKWCVLLTFALIFLGAIVTTSGAGMAAPNAPHVDGTLLNPNSPVTNTVWWKDPALLKEHSHRLIAMSLGASIGALAALLWRNWTAFFIAFAFMGAASGLKAFKLPPDIMAHLRIWPAMIIFVVLVIRRAKKRGEKPSAEQWMVLAAYIAACLQALVGTLRVEIETAGYVNAATNVRVIHGVFAQGFLALLVILAARLSPVYRTLEPHQFGAKFTRMAFSLLILYFLQLACAAYIRHQGVGMLISTWPQANPEGGMWPPAGWTTGDDALRHKLAIHFLHTRIIPILILGHVIGLAIGLAKRMAGHVRFTRLGWAILILVLLQIVLGVMVIWKGRHPHITNTHVMIGALICALTALLYTRARRCRLA